jgi:CRP-like cAMP-binding protein
MTDLLDTIRSDIAARLSELRPLVEEAEQLQRAADALGGNGSIIPAPRAQRTTGRRRGGATVRGQTGQRIVEYVKANPGSTAGDVASALGLKRNSTGTRLAQLAKAGELRKAKRGYSAP